MSLPFSIITELTPHLSKAFLAFGDIKILAPMILIGLIFYERYFLIPTLLLLLTIILSALLKLAFAIPYSPELVAKLGKGGFAFPSGHMQSAAVFYGWFITTITAKWIRFTLIALIIGIGSALVHEGYHSVYDIFGGLFFAVITIGFYQFLISLVSSKRVGIQDRQLGAIIIFSLSICLAAIMVFLYDLPSYFATILYFIAGFSSSSWLSWDNENHKVKITNSLLIVCAFFVTTLLLFISEPSHSFLWEAKWFLLSSLLPLFASLIKDGYVLDKILTIFRSVNSK
jgi:hypothetical protein